MDDNLNQAQPTQPNMDAQNVQNVQPDMSTQNMQNAQPGMNVQNMQYGQPNQNMSGKSVQYTQYGQPNQNMGGQSMQYTQYGQPNQNMGGQNMQYTQYGQPNQNMNGQYYNQQGYVQQAPRPSVNLGAGIRNVQSQFKGRVNRMGLSTFCLLGIIAAMLLIVAPFMNFASIHVNQKIEEEGYIRDIKIKIKASDGLNLFELAKLSGTIDRVIDEMGGFVDKDDLVDELDDAEEDVIDDLEDEFDTDVRKSSVRETFGTMHLVLKGHAATVVTPWILIICGLGLLIFTVINNKTMKLVFSITPLACLIWLMICSSHFFSIMGIGAWAIILGIVLGTVSALQDKQAY